MRHVSFCRSYRCRSTSRPLRCESLEDRRLLTLTVDTLVDEADGNIDDGDISLRDAIAVASPGETIDFDASLDGGPILLTMGALSIPCSVYWLTTVAQRRRTPCCQAARPLTQATLISCHRPTSISATAHVSLTGTRTI
jgi:hypothetical protein